MSDTIEKMPTPISSAVNHRSMCRVRAAIATTIDRPR